MTYDGANIVQLRQTLKDCGLSPNKRLGQNFLCDANIADAIVRAAGDLSGRQVLEIGPGAGALTVRLLEKAGHVTAIELDAGLYRLLCERMNDPRLTLIHGDALKVPLSEVGLTPPLTLVANLPYYATTPLLMRYLAQSAAADRFVLMMQKEVAQRLSAPPGGKDYGALSVAVQYYASVQHVLSVSPSCFYPAPKVSSTVVLLERREPAVRPLDEDMMFRVVRAAFAMRRKTLLNNLSAMENLGRQGAQKALEICGLDGTKRGETLSPDLFIALSDAISDVTRDRN